MVRFGRVQDTPADGDISSVDLAHGAAEALSMPGGGCDHKGKTLIESLRHISSSHQLYRMFHSHQTAGVTSQCLIDTTSSPRLR